MRRRAADPRTRWRLYYQMPPTDPRVLDATDEDVLLDLLTLEMLGLLTQEDPMEEMMRAMADPDVREQLTRMEQEEENRAQREREQRALEASRRRRRTIQSSSRVGGAKE